MNLSSTFDKVTSAQRLLLDGTTTLEKFESVRTILKGVNPALDKKLQACSSAIARIQNLKKGEVIDLSAVALPETTEEEKKRKKAILFFIRTWKDLKNEVARVQNELRAKSQGQGVAEIGTKISAKSKGPFGVITLAAVAIVGVGLFLNREKLLSLFGATTPTSPQRVRETIQVIEFEGKRIPLTELVIGAGPDCDSDHYHASNDISAQALDGSTVADPGGCGYGRTSEAKIIEVE